MSNRYYKTQTFYAAVFLFSKGIELVNIQSESGSRRSTFVFINSPECELLVDRYNFAPANAKEVLCDIREIVLAIRSLKEKLYQYQQ